MTSANAPSGVSVQPSRDPARAASMSAPKRSSSIASKALSRENQSLRASPKVGVFGAPNQHSRTARASAVSVPAARSTIAIAHPVRGLEERCQQSLPQRLGKPNVFHRPPHAAKPLIPLAGRDRKRHMPGAQPGMAEPADVMIGAAHPSAQEPEELVARAIERLGMQSANPG